MSAVDFLNLLMEILFTALAVLTLTDFVRYRDAMRRDVALLFGLLSVPFVVVLGTDIAGAELPMWVAVLAVAALIAEPYALMRLLKYLRVVPPIIVKLAFYGMIVSVAALLLSGGVELHPLPTLAIQIYFIGLNFYAMVGFVRGALHSAGVVRQRLRFAAAGCGLFGLTLVASIVGSASPPIALVGQVLGIVCALAFYIGFAPPRWVRRTWQLSETSDYLAQLTNKSLNERLNIDEVMSDLCKAANRSVGGMTAGIVRKDADDQKWVLAYSDGPAQISVDGASIIGRTWAYAAPAFLRVSDHLSSSDQQLLKSVDAGTLLITPIITTEGVWGLLLVFLKYGSLFVDDDLHFLTLLAKQNAMLLENGVLVERLLKLNTELELRASQLTAANKELEAFSYSVSHDLRAPLRAIDGFSQVLQEDHADSLDEDGKKYLARIRAASQRMGQLIDDLLELSRLSRSQLKRSEVNLSEMARKIAGELREQNPGREVDFVVEDGMVANGDVALLRVVMNNLMGNAWKYTGKQPSPEVTFGCVERGSQRAYFVRDNGAGFDMEYADKLFGVFQRLHSANEFPGNGIGLATVQRIIHRHGGQVWAESAVDQGATFYFSL
jgi:signal transduction histidine kinase